GQRRTQRRQPQFVLVLAALVLGVLRNRHAVEDRRAGGDGGWQRVPPTAARRQDRPAGGPASGRQRLALFGKVAPLVGLGKALHLAERRDAGDGVKAGGPAVGDSAKQFVLDVNGAARHAGDDPGPLQTEA